MKEGYVYRIIAPGSNSVYVGQSINPSRRFKQHKRHTSSPGLANFLKKHPDATIHPWPTNDMDADEIADAQLCRDMGFNLLNFASCGGGSPMLGRKHTPETLKKMSESQKKIDRSGQMFSPAFHEASRLAKLGVPRSAETRAKLRAAMTGRTLTHEHRAKLSGAKRGVPKSAEHRANMSAAKKGIPKSAEHRAKISAALKGKAWSPARRAARG
jgi:hypothetical protein